MIFLQVIIKLIVYYSLPSSPQDCRHSFLNNARSGSVLQAPTQESCCFPFLSLPANEKVLNVTDALGAYSKLHASKGDLFERRGIIQNWKKFTTKTCFWKVKTKNTCQIKIVLIYFKIFNFVFINLQFNYILHFYVFVVNVFKFVDLLT